jgi:Family of unknown function (DUF5990)
VGVQRRNRPDELFGLVGGDAPSASWAFECKATPSAKGWDLLGPYIQGGPGGRFIYLSWVTRDEGAHRMFRRAKLLLDVVPSAVIEDAAPIGVLVGRLGLTGSGGGPLCAAVRPPAIEWSAEAAG